MYNYKRPAQIEQEKNPNRVLGGLKGSGADSYKMLGEDGTEKEIPTQRYARSLEEKIRKQDAVIENLQKQVNRLSRDQQSFENYLKATRKN